MEYFKTKKESKEVRCSDDNCPCSETIIQRGEGFLYLDPEIIKFRRIYPRDDQAIAAIKEKRTQIQGSFGFPIFSPFVKIGPILVCEKGAKLRGLDLEIASSDAKLWWKSGKVPLRPTPLAGSREAEIEKNVLRFSKLYRIGWWPFWKKRVPRFVDNKDGTITDHQTFLIWQKEDSNKGYIFDEALFYCRELKLAKQNDWRLPTAREFFVLFNLIDLPFSIIKNKKYWTCSNFGYEQKKIYTINLYESEWNADEKSKEFFVRAVR